MVQLEGGFLVVARHAIDFHVTSCVFLFVWHVYIQINFKKKCNMTKIGNPFSHLCESLALKKKMFPVVYLFSLKSAFIVLILKYSNTSKLKIDLFICVCLLITYKTSKHKEPLSRFTFKVLQ